MDIATKPLGGLTAQLINGVLSIKPLGRFIKARARQMMINRAELIGVNWRSNVNQLEAIAWEEIFKEVTAPDLEYPDYYITSFHAYETGNLSWQAAWEVESAAQAVHAKIWSEGDPQGDAMLRQSYHQIMQQELNSQPNRILDLGCGVGMSAFALQKIYPQAKVTGVDLSPYFLSVAKYRAKQGSSGIQWLHAPAESTELPAQSFDLVSACLMFHELPASAARNIIREARRVLAPGGYLSIMDMNPQSEVFTVMPSFVMTLLKSTEPYLDQYLGLDLTKILVEAGFAPPQIVVNSPRHRTVIAQVV